MDTSTVPPGPPTLRPWLVRIPEIFAPISTEILSGFGAVSTTRLGQDFFLIKTADPASIRQSGAAPFASWNLPMDHTWPCHPRHMEGFVEKAAQSLWRKFGPLLPQGLFAGQLHPTSRNPYYRALASNLRGRALQLFSGLPAVSVEDQIPDQPTLFVLAGREGLFSGLQSPLACNGFYPGGSKFIDQDSPSVISRAGAKIAEALHYLRLHRPALPPGSHWLELGASPGGMTAELLSHGYRVTAVDRASLDRRLRHRPELVFTRQDVALFTPAPAQRFQALLCDLNGPALQSIGQVIRLAPFLAPRGLVIFTLKLPRVTTLDEPAALGRAVVATAEAAGLRLFAQTHLTYNRHELTLFFERASL